jgi:hypothetical protein
MPLSRLIYYSENQLDPHNGPILTQLKNIVAVSKKNNQAQDITGALAFDDLWFIQTLEGERITVLQTFERLKEDERHANIMLVELRDIDQRLFGNWWMGLATRNEITMPGFEPFLQNGRLMPHGMSGEQFLTLITSVAKLSESRKILDPAA